MRLCKVGSQGLPRWQFFDEYDDIRWKAHEIRITETGVDEFRMKFLITGEARKKKTGEVEAGQEAEEVKVKKENGKWKIASHIG